MDPHNNYLCCVFALFSLVIDWLLNSEPCCLLITYSLILPCNIVLKRFSFNLNIVVFYLCGITFLFAQWMPVFQLPFCNRELICCVRKNTWCWLGDHQSEISGSNPGPNLRKTKPENERSKSWVKVFVWIFWNYRLLGALKFNRIVLVWWDFMGTLKYGKYIS